MNRPDSKSLEDLLVEASKSAKLAPEAEPWEFGWAVENYRHSGFAAIAGPDGPVIFSDDGVRNIEIVARRLLLEPAVKVRWSAEDFWGYVASLAMHVARSDDPGEQAKIGIRLLRKSPPSLVAMPLANTSWVGPPKVIGNLVIGTMNQDWVQAVNEAAAESAPSLRGADDWIVKQERHSADLARNELDKLVMLACWTIAQGFKSGEEATRSVEVFFSSILLLSDRSPDGDRLLPMRAAVNKPGPRGLMLDRPAMTGVAVTNDFGQELSTHLFHAGSIYRHSQLRWYSAEPFKLSSYLEDGWLSEAVGKVLTSESAIGTRLRIASRWYGAAHWSDSPEDAALALGVAMDTMVGSKAGLPGRQMSERWAFLDPEPTARSNRVKEHAEIYKVRSSVAHGSRSSKLDDESFMEHMAGSVRWTARRLYALLTEKGVQEESEFESFFENIRWGLDEWS